jgi:hypothetical protein
LIFKASKYDKAIINDLMLKYKNEAKIDQFKDVGESQYWHQLLDQIIAGRGVIFLAENYGILIAMILPSIWSDKIMLMHEMAWYVTPERRGSSAGYRLMKAYLDYGNDLKQNGRIKGFTMSKMPSSPDLNYDRFGFKKLDENWIQ